jgi:hypothetical protein
VYIAPQHDMLQRKNAAAAKKFALKAFFMPAA